MIVTGVTIEDGAILMACIGKLAKGRLIHIVTRMQGY